MTSRALFNRNTLRMVGITENLDRVAIFTRRDIAQGISLPDHVFAFGRNRADILNKLVPKAAFKKGGAKRGRADPFKLLARCVAKDIIAHYMNSVGTPGRNHPGKSMKYDQAKSAGRTSAGMF
jgi:hypothetical protein